MTGASVIAETVHDLSKRRRIRWGTAIFHRSPDKRDPGALGSSGFGHQIEIPLLGRQEARHQDIDALASDVGHLVVEPVPTTGTARDC
jgi:hypothetical protein